MKRIKALLVAIILVVGILIPTTGLANPGVTVSITDAALPTGASGSVVLSISGATEPVSCVDVDISYDPAVVEVTGASGSDFDTLVSNIQDNHTHLVAFVTSPTGLTGTIKVADISLKCLGGESELALDVITLKDDDGQSIPFTVVNGWVIAERIGISQPLPEETPPEETLPEETPPEETSPAPAETPPAPAEQAPTEQGPAEQAPSSPSRTTGWPMVAWAGIAAGAAIVITLIVVLARRRRY